MRPAMNGNLSGAVSAFIGRDGELARLRALQLETRLLTLVGPAGVGKTRLGLWLQAEVRDAFPDGIWLVDLSPLADPALLPQVVGDVLGVRQPQAEAWLPALVRALRGRCALLLLDNCEHLLGARAKLADELLRACPAFSLLATSRQPLGVAGETTWRVPPLAVPAAGAGDIQELGASDAVQLFVTRVRVHLPDFELSERNALVVAEICRRLDGLPLALELVAARVEGLGLAEVAARLSDRFALAIGAPRTAPARQRTLQAALNWSCGLLDKDERVLLRRLGVFVGGWTLEAASWNRARQHRRAA
jgi:non-specific serine/threonine protein kinase